MYTYIFNIFLYLSDKTGSLGSGSADGACHADDLDCYSGNVQDRLGMEAIRTLHRQLDDDDNGNIDLSESDDVSTYTHTYVHVHQMQLFKEFFL